MDSFHLAPLQRQPQRQSYLSTNKTMPTYIGRGGNQSLVAPVALDSTQFYIFLLKGNKEQLQALLDQLFNQPSGHAVKYEAFLDYVVVMFTHVDRLVSNDPNQGWAAYGDIAMWVPVCDRTHTLPRFKMYPAYMVVDNSATMATGRETYGFPKEMGTFTQPQNPGYIGDLTVDVLGFAADSPTRQVIPSRLWKVVRSSGEADQPAVQQVDSLHQLFSAMEQFAEGLGEHLAEDFLMGLGHLTDLLHMSSLLSVPALGLQEIRDIEHTQQAAFQAIVEAPLTMEKFHSAKIFLDKFTFFLNDLATHPVAADTGLKIGPQEVVFACWLYADFELGTGKVIQKINS